MRRAPATVAIPRRVADGLEHHLLRSDGQEDVCFVTYRLSTGAERTTAIIDDVVLPEPGERAVHGNASFTGAYVTRAAALAASRGAGLALAHSHPHGRGWQGLSRPDVEAELSYAFLVSEITGFDLLGLTLAGATATWSARTWAGDGTLTWASSVRVVGDTLAMSFNDELRPAPASTSTQIRTVSAWGEHLHRDIVRLRVLIVGVGSVGLEVALRLAATGIAEIGIMDFDRVEAVNLDRLVGATPIDAVLRRHKVRVASRLLRRAATAERFTVHEHILSVCEPDGLAIALDYDIIISCVDRPWPRGVLNTIAYSDVIPIIDGGIHIDAFPDGGMRGATWRAHVLRPGRPCLVCNGQLDPAMVPLDREGMLDDPTYIAQSGITARSRQNVAALSASVSSSILALFVSLVAGPGGLGEPGPLRYNLATHTLVVLECASGAHCPFEAAVAAGDDRPVLNAEHPVAAAARVAHRLPARLRLLAAASCSLERAQSWLETRARSEVGRDHRSGPGEGRGDPRGEGPRDEHRKEK